MPAANRFAPALPGVAGVASRGVQLTLDHVILRAADPAAALAELAEKLAAPVLVPVTEAGPFKSGLIRAGALDIEVLALGSTPPPRVQGYGLGFLADVPLAEASADAARRSASRPRCATGATANGRSWAAVQIHGLLPDPFPLPTSTRTARA